MLNIPGDNIELISGGIEKRILGDICGTAEPAVGWQSGRVRRVHRTIRRQNRRASGWLQGRRRTPYRQERAVETPGENPEMVDPHEARRRRA
jgi:hypothetical protein